MVAAFAKAIPVPFIGDSIATRCDRFVVRDTLQAKTSIITPDRLRPFYAIDNPWTVGGVTRSILKLPMKVLTFPIRRLIATAAMIKNVPLTVIRSVLLGRTLDRVLATGFLSEGSSTSDTTIDERIAAMRTSFDLAFASIHWDIAKAAISDAMSQASWWQSTAARLLAQYRKNSDIIESEVRDDEAIQSEAEKIRDAIQQPKVLELFNNFDNQFDTHLSEITADWAACISASENRTTETADEVI